jgi:TrmH family RNA methyltransferase
MLSKANIKFIKSLQVKKYRKQEQCFLVEGAKSVLELLSSDFEIVKILGTSEFLAGIQRRTSAEIIEVRENELDGLGQFQSNNSALAVVKMKPNLAFTISPQEYALVLDDLRDPGNLGTIIRTADWYGINKIIASDETADVYNPKVITSTMGSFARVKVFYTRLQEYLPAVKANIYGAYLEGSNVHHTKFAAGGLVVIGSESHGISENLQRYITDKITIPGFGKAESLNAAIAAAVIMDNIRRGS